MPTPKPRENADGSVSWRLQYRVKGKPTTTSFTNYKGAQQFADLVENIGGTEAHAVYLARRDHVAIPTLREWTAKYLDVSSGLLTGIEPGTRNGYRGEADRTFLPFLGDYPVNAITKTTVGKWVAWQEKQTVHRDRNKPEAERERVSSKTVHNAHALLSSVLAAAVAEKLIEENPAYRTRLSKGQKREAVFLSPDEFATVLTFIPKKHLRLILFLAGTGTRWSEATAATWSDITLHAELPTVRISKAWKKGRKPVGIPKSKKARRTVSMFPELVAALGTPGEPSELIFPNEVGTRLDHGHFTDRVWKRAIAKATDADECVAAGVVRLTRAPNIHHLRHTHASWLIARGVPLPYIQVRLGHESYNTTVDSYGHLVPDAHEQMAAVISSTLADIPFLPRTELPELTP